MFINTTTTTCCCQKLTVVGDNAAAATPVYIYNPRAGETNSKAVLINQCNGYSNSTRFIQFQVAAVADGYIVSEAGTLGFAQESDCRKKCRIRATKCDSLSLINSLEVVDYQWKDQYPGVTKQGLIAQEVKKVLPELVSTDGTYLNLHYEGLGVHYLKAIQQLTECIEKLEKAITK
jgi:hypothetical protein